MDRPDEDQPSADTESFLIHWAGVRQALRARINFFDTADAYSRGASETIVGSRLKEMAPRDEVVIATKVFAPMGSGPNDRGLSRKHIVASIDASLRRLQISPHGVNESCAPSINQI